MHGLRFFASRKAESETLLTEYRMLAGNTFKKLEQKQARQKLR